MITDRDADFVQFVIDQVNERQQAEDGFYAGLDTSIDPLTALGVAAHEVVDARRGMKRGQALDRMGVAKPIPSGEEPALETPP